MAEVQKDTIGSTEVTLRFLDMVSLLTSQAMIALGKVINPVTGKAEKNLPAARLFIDTLEMLEVKTKGNLTADEERVLRTSLTDLRLMYVEECKEPAASPPSSATAATPPPAASEPESKVKFQKKYD
ncbi:MAG: DUF1844 domain-containing protein [Verrucomicrobiae bacterium]|nr:DUF1844 domain-containing protein [Verrucomicrobiae bacterium]